MASPIVAGAAALTISLAKSRFGVNLTPSQVEEILLASSPVNSTLTTVFKGGKTLDLKALAAEILNNKFPEPQQVCP
jgi:subtilisin family serine protease